MLWAGGVVAWIYSSAAGVEFVLYLTNIEKGCDMTARPDPDATVVAFELGDLMRSGADAIVNAANSRLEHGGGVCGAVFAAAGPAELAAMCRPLAPCATGDAVITGSGRLVGRGTNYIVHAVGPRWSSATERLCDEQLAACYRRSLELADEYGLESIAFPSISTGIFGFPPERAAPVVAQVMHEYSGGLRRIINMFTEPVKRDLYRAAFDAHGAR